jgi:hypothetical protein
MITTRYNQQPRAEQVRSQHPFNHPEEPLKNTDSVIIFGGPKAYLGSVDFNWLGMIKSALEYAMAIAYCATQLEPAYAGLNLSLFRHFKIREPMHLEFRAESYNLPNHRLYTTLGTIVGTVSFGSVVTGTDNPRTTLPAFKVTLLRPVIPSAVRDLTFRRRI